MSYLAPAGTPIHAADLWWGLRALPARKAVLEDFRATLMADLALAGCEFVSSGRAGMSLLLQVLGGLTGDPRRNEVIIPAYTCYSVPASIERAGYRIRVCDIRPECLSYHLGKLANFDFSRVLAIVSANLYGIPNDLPAIEALARRHGVYLVDDAAQCLGATMEGQPVGTFGDAGVFSMDKGKNITSMQGGILVSRDPAIGKALANRVARLPPPALGYTLTQCIKLLAYAALLPPTRYGLTRRLPFLGLGRTPYHTPSPLARYSPALGLVALATYRRLESLGTARRENAHRLVEALAGTAGIAPVTLPPGAEAVYVRLPMLAPDRTTRQALLEALDAAGIGATASYPAAVVDIPELQGRLDARDLDCPGARSVASRIFTLPTHPFVGPGDAARIARTIRSVLA